MRAIDVVVLAAGVGSRLRPITDERPKCLVEVAGKPLLHRLLEQIELLRESVPLKVHVVIGYMADAIRGYFHDKPFDLNLVENSQFKETNNMFSLSLTFDSLEFDRDLVIVNGDCAYESTIIADLILSRQSAIAVDSSVFYEESMKVKVSDGRIRGISKRYPPQEGVITSIDIYKFVHFEKERLIGEVRDRVSSGVVTEWTEVAIDRISQDEGVTLVPLDVSGRKWVEIDDHRDLETARSLFG